MFTDKAKLKMDALNEFLTRGSTNLNELEHLVRLVRKEEDDRKRKLQVESARIKRRKRTKRKQDLRKLKTNGPAVITRRTVRQALVGEIPLNQNIQRGMQDTLGVLKCVRCDLVKPKEHFNGSLSVCYVCKLAKVGSPCPVESFCHKIFHEIKGRCKQKNFPISITPEWIKQRYDSMGGCCELCGDELTTDRSFAGDGNERVSLWQYPSNLSVDRIDSDRGYMTDNCQLVHLRCNLMKNDMTLEKFIELCAKISDRHNNK